MSPGHHRGEEELFFPKLEAACGEKGLMDANVEQHRKPSSDLLSPPFKSPIEILMNVQMSSSPASKPTKRTSSP